jgi:hypothetical protein
MITSNTKHGLTIIKDQNNIDTNKRHHDRNKMARVIKYVKKNKAELFIC